MFERIVKEPSYQEAKANLALAYKSIGEIERSLNIYKNLEFVDPGLKSKFNYGNTLITIGNFEEGWINYEYRWKVTPYNQGNMAISGQAGEREKYVALWREQGIGDDIIFLSLCRKLKRCAAAYRYMWIHVYKPYASVPCPR